MSILARIRRLTEWWRPKGGFLVSLLLFCFALNETGFSDAIEFLGWALLTLLGFGVTGYLLNDWSDLKSDRKVGKSNSLEGISVPLRVALLLLSVAITAFPWITYFKTDGLSIALIVAQVALLIVYPVPPIRLKRIAPVAVVIDALYAFTIPALLAFHTLFLSLKQPVVGAEVYVSLAVWMFFMGLRHIINHHVKDKEADRRSRTANLALRYSTLRLRGIIQHGFFPLELVGCLFFFALVAHAAGFFPLLMLLVAAVFGYNQFSSKSLLFSVSFGQTGLDRFTSFWLGFLSVALLALDNSRFVAVLLLFLLLFSDLFQHPIIPVIASNFFQRLKVFLLFPFQVLSLTFNWSLYYFRKWILGWSEERNWGEHYQKHLADERRKALKTNGIVALFNQNYQKYTETFVEGHLKHLPFHVVSFHGWPSPMHVGDMENLISKHDFLQKAWYNALKLFNLNVEYLENRLIADRLVDEKVEVILAEFGTMAQRILPVAKETGIPLVVIFHGYDAWHRNVLQQHDYTELFDYSSHVIGVSRDICNQLVKLGCDEKKLTYLPCFIDLELFKPIEREFQKPELLSIGRLTNTKAPHLTILAFNEVLKEVPNAHLTMIGSDEDGATMEFCLSMIEALGISKSVEMKGVVAPHEIRASMEKASLLVQHSITTPINGDKEGTPAVIMEALATGLPIVATNHAGIQELVETGKNGVLVQELDYLSMANEIVKLLKDRDTLRKLSSGAITSIAKNELITDHNRHMELILKRAISQE